MNRRLILLFLLFAFVVPSMGALHAIDEPLEGAASLARYYPEDAVVYAATRIDEQFVDTLDDLVSTLTATLAELDVPPLTLRQMLFFTGLNPNEVLPWLGDHAALGVTGITSSGDFDNDSLQIVVELDDSEAALAYLIELIPEAEIIENQNSTLLVVPQDTVFEIYEDVMVIAIEQQTLPGAENSLVNNERFRGVLADLPEQAYNVLLYVDVPAVAATMEEQDGAELLAQAGAFALGATILDGRSLTIDIAQNLPNLPQGYLSAEPVNEEFLRFIPANTNALIHSTNLSAAIEGIFDLADMGANTAQSSQEEIASALAELGIDLQADILDWADGNYALFLHADTIPIIRDFTANDLNIEGRLEFGVVVEATDPAAAQGLATKVGDLMLEIAATNPSSQVKVGADTLAGLDVTAIQVTAEVPGQGDVLFNLVMGASQDVFFLTTRGAAESITNGEGTLAETEAYQSATTTFLPEPLFVAYTDGEGFFTTVAPFPALFFVGPTIGTVFENVLETLDGTPAPTPTPIPTPTPDPALEQQILETIQALYALVDSSSITATVTENSTLQIRTVLTLNP